ncbi:MAG: tRNA (adenosine(37)-N6)-dimethylallyltransferase MiaA [Bdellovibrionales bacterium]|nr:tRNA (adenosine(37)-N6)-dimethylallyltransferase MiaA [Bdellovibrionales bacterium]
MGERQPKIIVVTGPTASGKSALAVALGQRIGGAVVNADSVAVYQGFDIGSGKPDVLEQKGVPHYLLSHRSPDEPYDAGVFRDEAIPLIERLTSEGAVPIVCGGTGLYISALLGGLVQTSRIGEDAEARMHQLEASVPTPEVSRMLHRWLAERDPRTAAQLHPNDLHRLRRAVLVYLSSGCSLADLQAQHGYSDQTFQAMIFVLSPDRAWLYQKINERVRSMLDAGLVEETEALSERYGAGIASLGAIGYRHAAAFLRGNLDAETLETEMARDTRRFAKRQLTWWRNQPAKLGWRIGGAHRISGTWNVESLEELAFRETRIFLNGAEPDRATPVVHYLLSESFDEGL